MTGHLRPPRRHRGWSYKSVEPIQDGGLPPFWKKENRHNSAAVSDIFTKFGAGGHWQPATCLDVIFGLKQNPRWRPATILKNGKSQKPDSYLRYIFTNSLTKPQILFIEKLQAIYLMLYKRYKTAKIKKYKHEHYALA